MSVCPNPTQLEDFLAGRLTIEQHAALEGHILNCPNCQHQFDTMCEPADAFLQDFDLAISSVPDAPTFSDRRDPQQSQDSAQTNAEMSRAHASGIVGEYRLIRKVGQGGMGVVFEAEEIRLRRRVALKTLSFAHLIDPGRLKRFHNEARAAATLDDHPHIVTVFNVGVDRGLHYYAMRFIDGHNLGEIYDKLCTMVDRPGRSEEIRKRRNALKSGTTVPIARQHEIATTGSTDIDPLFVGDESARRKKVQSQTKSREIELPGILADLPPLGPTYVRAIAKLGVTAAQALAHAHKHGVMHRDIKPSNLMLDVDGRLWVTDFGLARIEAEAGTTISGAWMGTVRYMSPEHFSESGGVVDYRSDIYSLGVTLYEMLTLQPLFADASPQKLLESVSEGKIAPPRSVNPEIPVDLETIILKAISRDSSERYTTADAFAADLTRFLEHKPILAQRPTAMDRVGKWLRRYPSAILAALCALGVLFAIGVVLAKLYVDQGELVKQIAQSQQEQKELHQLSESQLYVADVGLAANAINERDTAAAFAYLARHRSTPGLPDRRGFEWYWLYSKYQNLSKTVPLSPNPLYRFELSPRGDLAAVAGKDAVIRILDTEFWEQRFELPTDHVEINCIAFSPDSQRIATGGDDGSVCVWDLTTAARVLRIPAHRKETWGVTFTADGEEIISGGTDDKVQFWSAENGQSTGWIPAHSNSVEDVRLSPDGKKLATSAAQCVFVWDLSPSTWTHGEKDDGSVESVGLPRARLAKVLRVRGDGKIPTFAFYDDGKRMITGGFDTEVRDWDLDTGKSRLIGKHLDQVASVDVSRDGLTVASGDRGGVIRTWNLKEPEPISPQVSPDWIWEVSKDQPLRWCVMTPDEGTVLAATNEKLVSRNVGSGEVSEIPLSDPSILRARDSDSPQIADLSADGKWLVVVNEILTPDAAPGKWKPQAKIPHPAEEIHAVKFSPDGKVIAVGNQSGRVWLHDTESGKQIGVREEPPGSLQGNLATVYVTTLAFSEGGSWLAASSSRNVPTGINYWHMQTGERQQSPPESRRRIRQIVFSPRSKGFATCAGDSTIRFWSSRNAEPRAEFPMENPARDGEVLSFSPDAQILAVADCEKKKGTIGLWSLQEEREFAHLKRGASHLQFSASSEKLLSGDSPATICLWDVDQIVEKTDDEEKARRAESPTIVPREAWAAVRMAHGGRVYSTRFMRDGNRLASVGSDGKVLIATRRPTEDFSRVSVPNNEVERFSGFDLADNGTMIAWEGTHGLWIFSPGEETEWLLRTRKPTLSSACLNAEGSRLAVAYADGDVRVFDADTHNLRRQIQVDLTGSEAVEQVAFIPKSPLILVRVVGDVRKNRYYNMDTGERVFGLPEMSGVSQMVARHSPRVAFSHERRVYWFDVTPGAPVVKIDELDDAIDQITISDDGRIIAGGTTTRKVHVWDADQGSSSRMDWLTHRRAVTAVSISRDGRTLASADEGGVVKLWDLQTKRQFYDLTRHLDSVWQIQFSTDGKRILCRSPQLGSISVFTAAAPTDQ